MEISEIVHQFKEITKQAKFNYNDKVEVIIKCRIKDKYRIEALLDLILDFCFDTYILLVYKKLVKYYFILDEEAATAYIYAYRELYDE